MQEAMFYENIGDNRVRCNLCAHGCVIAEGKFGVCKVRHNLEGTLYTRVYGRTISQHVDPIEKKPLYHFLPGAKAFSIATAGCNFQCRWCQNWEISQMLRESHLIAGRAVSPEEIVDSAMQTGCEAIAYTYTEPTIFFEYAYHIALLAHLVGLANVYVTNGYMGHEMLEISHPYLDAANVDLKSFRKKTYQHYIKAGLKPVLENLKTMKRLGIWVEVTTLVIPGLNDSQDELRDIAQFIVTDLGPDTPWHISRFFPGYKMKDRQPTPLKTLQQARSIGLAEGLHYVYLGNVGEDANTYCQQCKRLLIRRQGYWVTENHIKDGRCADCGTSVAGVWISRKPPAVRNLFAR